MRELFWPLEFRIYIFRPMRMTDAIIIIIIIIIIIVVVVVIVYVVVVVVVQFIRAIKM